MCHKQKQMGLLVTKYCEVRTKKLSCIRLKLLLQSSLGGSMEGQHSKSQQLLKPHLLVKGDSQGARVQYLMMGRSRPRCKLRKGGEQTQKERHRESETPQQKPKCHTICQRGKKTHKKKKNTNGQSFAAGQ